MSLKSSRPGCSLLSFGYTCLLVGCLFGVIGALWHIPHLTRTDGVIVQSGPMSSWSNARLITYEYTACGVRHRGQRLFRWGRSIPAGFYETGQPFVRLFRDGQARSQLWPVSARQDCIRRLCDYVRRVRNHGYLLGVSIMTPYQSMKPASPLTNNFRAFATCSGLPFLIRCFQRA